MLRPRIGAVQGARFADRRPRLVPAGLTRDRCGAADAGRHRRCWPRCSPFSSVSRSSPRRRTGRIATLDEQQVRQRAFGALRSLLGRISRRSPIVWFIDDLQWGDADSAEVIVRGAPAARGPLGTVPRDVPQRRNRRQRIPRRRGRSCSTSTTSTSPTAKSSWRRLTVEECTELVIDLLGKDNERIRQRAAEFAQETRGNPFLLIELVGCFDPETDSFEPMPLHEVLGRKLGRLPDEAGHLLEVVAVSGQALSLEEASRTAGHALPPMATISRMRNERLVPPGRSRREAVGRYVPRPGTGNGPGRDGRSITQVDPPNARGDH